MCMDTYEEHLSSYFSNFKVKDFDLDLRSPVPGLHFFLFNWIGFKRKLYIKMMSRSQPSVLLDKIGSTKILMTFMIKYLPAGPHLGYSEGALRGDSC